MAKEPTAGNLGLGQRVRVSIRLTDTGMWLLDTLCHRKGIERSALVEQAVRQMASAHRIPDPAEDELRAYLENQR